MKNANVNKGEIWFVKFESSPEVKTMRIDDVTEHTILLIDINRINSAFSCRYLISDVDLVEMVKK